MPEAKGHPIPDYADVFTMEDFAECVQNGSFIDYDGTGYYSDGNRQFHKIATLTEPLDRSYSHVAWYNK